MDFSEPDDWRQIRLEAEAFTAEHITEAMIADELSSGDGVNRPLMTAMGERGWIAPTWPEDEGRCRP